MSKEIVGASKAVEWEMQASFLAHELKNRLNSMVIQLELLRSKLEPNSSMADETRPQIDVLLAEIERLDRAVAKLLHLTHPSDSRGCGDG
jgi:signal transduction histidine kinase